MRRFSDIKLPSCNPASASVQRSIYTELPLGRWFRLMTIHPGYVEEALECDLKPVKLDFAPPYKALSYAWGDGTALKTIKCSGAPKLISHNLLQGLRHIRSNSQPLVIWVDAICIDQEYEIEKGHQVDLMGTIYEKASEVIVWLGDDELEIASTAFQTLINVNSAIQSQAQHTLQCPPRTDAKDHHHALHFRAVGKDEPDFFAKLLGSLQKESLKALYTFPWFTRVWVLQEVGLARRATAVWGSSKVDFYEIALFIYFSLYVATLETWIGPDLVTILHGAPHHALWSVWCTFGKETWIASKPPLKDLAIWISSHCHIDFVLILEASKRFRASNPLDHVYAFLGHPKATPEESMEPILEADYTLDLEELHYKIACRLASDSLNFLVQVQHISYEDLTSEEARPSWIPHWNVHSDQAPIAVWEIYDASLRVRYKRPTNIRITGNHLTVDSIFLDTIGLRNDILNGRKEKNPVDVLCKWIETCWDIVTVAEGRCLHPYTEATLIAFASTLCFDYRRGQSAEACAAALCRICRQHNPTFYGNVLRCESEICHISDVPEPKGFEYGLDFAHYCTGRRFFTTEKGRWGLGPPLLQPGDICAILFGADVPLILRPSHNQGQYKLVGQCYFHGVMYGEAVQLWEIGQLGVQKVANVF
ncbi:heterokaryon incompatibility protein-domain-containing protein [Whalleya microplaca]|nr:heterokaryon incompatibility protein-domain-containing protein [Whalleya microplaca]